MLSGCSFIEKGGRGRQDRRVARIGQEVLYESDIVRLMPEVFIRRQRNYGQSLYQHLGSWSR